MRQRARKKAACGTGYGVHRARLAQGREEQGGQTKRTIKFTEWQLGERVAHVSHTSGVELHVWLVDGRFEPVPLAACGEQAAQRDTSLGQRAGRQHRTASVRTGKERGAKEPSFALRTAGGERGRRRARRGRLTLGVHHTGKLDDGGGGQEDVVPAPRHRRSRAMRPAARPGEHRAASGRCQAQAPRRSSRPSPAAPAPGARPQPRHPRQQPQPTCMRAPTICAPHSTTPTRTRTPLTQTPSHRQPPPPPPPPWLTC